MKPDGDGVTPGGTSQHASPDLPTVAAAGILVYATALMAHELAHALVGQLVGGTPTLVSSTGTRGDWSTLGAPGILAVGVSGSLANLVLAVSGWTVARRGRGAPTAVTALGWLLFAVNAWIPVTRLVVSPALDIGDWSTVVSAFPAQGPLRASLTVAGLFLVALLWKETAPSLARTVGGGSRAGREARARRLVRAAWLSGGVIALVASLLGPLDASWAVAVGAGSTLGTTWPILPAAARVTEHPVPGRPLRLPRTPWLLLAGTIAGLVLVLVFGPGLRPDG